MLHNFAEGANAVTFNKTQPIIPDLLRRQAETSAERLTNPPGVPESMEHGTGGYN